jgi:hypothetical protein
MSTKRSSVLAPGLLVLVALASAPALVKAKPAGRANKSSKSGPVKGRVLSSWYWSPSGRYVHLKDHDAVVIGKDGAFSFDGVPAPYEVWIGDFGNRQITVYRGVTRRDPLLMHGVGAEDQPERKATVHGILRGGLRFPLEPDYDVVTYFLSDQATARWSMRQLDNLGPRFGRMRVAWNGPASVEGTLLAMGVHFESGPILKEVFAAESPLKITDGEESSKELKFEPLPVGRIAGEIKTRLHATNGHVAFHLSGNRGTVDLECKLGPGPYSCDVPDLSKLGGEYCMSLIDGEAAGRTQHCGGRIGMEDFSFSLEPPPQLRALERPGIVWRSTVLSWSGEEQAVYSVKIAPHYMEHGKWFELEIFFVGPRLMWPDLAAYGIEARNGCRYKVKIVRHHPYRSMDELTGAHGPLSPQASFQEAVSEDITLTLME